MDYKQYCERAILNDPPLSNIPVVHLPCPHKTYKRKVINRAALTHEQHTALLATPKGFTWDKNTGLASPPNRGMNEESNGDSKAMVFCSDQRYVSDFTTDIWNTMTPKYRRKLERILRKEFNMSKKKAKEFIKEQKLRSAFSQRRPQSRVNLSERHEWVREIADILADKLTSYVAEMLSARRTKKVEMMAKSILEGFGDLTGEHCEFDQPKNRIQKMQVFASDRLAVWLSKITGDYDEELCRDLMGNPDTDTSDDESSDEEKKGKADSKPKKKPEPEGPKPEESKPAEPKPEEPKHEEHKELADSKPEEHKPDETKPTQPNPEEHKPAEPKPEEHKADETKPIEPKPTQPKPEEHKPAENKPEEHKPAENKPGEPKPAEPKPEEHKPA